MSYTTGGLIEATDYNGFTGSTTGNVSGKINSVWATGNGNAGYGQTAITDVSAGNTVTAAQWTNLINALNSARLHQSGVNSGITAPSAGGTISAFSTLSTQLGTIYTNRLSAALNGTTVTGTTHTRNIVVAPTSLASPVTVAEVNFGTTDAARYFFNAGGKFNVIMSAVDNSGGVERSIQLRDCINAIGGINNYGAYTNSGRTGTGETLTTNNTNVGYWMVVPAFGANIVRVDTDYVDYSGMYVLLFVYNTGSTAFINGSYGEKFEFRITTYIPADDSSGGTVDITLSARIDTVPPSATYLSNTWGTPSITWSNS